MRILIIQNCEIERLDLFERYLSLNKINYAVFHAWKNEKFPSVEKFNAFLIGGTPLSVCEADNHKFLLNEKNYIKKLIELEKPLIGICCGAQLIASVLGAEVTKNPVMEIGIYNVNLTESGHKDPVFKGFPAKFPVFHWHGDTFDIPGNAHLLAKGKDCNNQAFRYENAVGLQFHLEVTCASAARWADMYKNELLHTGKTKERITEDCSNKADEIKKSAYLFMDNFLNITEGVK